MVLWRSGYAAVCKTAYTGSIPVGTSIFMPDSVGPYVQIRANNKNGANEETLTLDLFLGKEAL